MNKKLRLLVDIGAVILANSLYAFGVAAFVKPAGLITGGTTGISLALGKMLGWNVSVTVFIINFALFILGSLVLGKKFAATTALSTFVYPAALELWQKILPAQGITHDLLLCTLFGGLCIGCGITLAMRVGASTGGMDIPPLVLNRLFKLPIAPMLYICDMMALGFQAFFSSWEQILYGILALFVYTITLNKGLILGKSMVELKVVSEKIDDIRVALLSKVDRGGTLIKSRTGYKLKDTEMLMSVLSSRELLKAEKLIHQIDPNAFVIVNPVTEVAGRGFTLNKLYLD